MNEKVTLQPAYEWICPDCGALQFERSAVPDLDDEEAQDLREQLGVEPWETGMFCMMPTEVTCAKCNSTFSTGHYGDEEDDDDMFTDPDDPYDELEE